jgi:hypothetical protein
MGSGVFHPTLHHDPVEPPRCTREHRAVSMYVEPRLEGATAWKDDGLVMVVA